LRGALQAVTSRSIQSDIQKRGALVSFESKLIELFCNADSAIFEYDNIRIGLVCDGCHGDVTVSLVAQEMRDFCVLDVIDDVILASFAQFLLQFLKDVGASRMRIGPVGGKVSNWLQQFLRMATSTFIFRDVVLSVEPLIEKRGNESLTVPRSLRRALRNVSRMDLAVGSDSYSAAEMNMLHVQRWGDNRSQFFFEAMKTFTKETYCDCISLKDDRGHIVGQQIDFIYSNKRHFYYSISETLQHPGIGTALLSESIKRFVGDPNENIYSFGRGGEEYKYRYANTYRLNHYIVGFRVNNLEELR
jgi:hypothetical protein